MRTIILGPRPAELDALIARRHALGLDGHDEVWEGEYHMAPMAHPFHGYVDRQLAVLLEPLARRAGLVGTTAFNLGLPGDFRVPDGGYHRKLPSTVYVVTAAIVVEIASPDDETWGKLNFYAAHGVDEILVATPAERSLTWLVLGAGTYERCDHSPFLGEESRKLASRLDWPPA